MHIQFYPHIKHSQVFTYKTKRIKTMCLTKDLRYETDNTINKKY